MRPLDGIKVIEMAGLAPVPYCGMILADFGADVVVVDRVIKHMPEIPNAMPKNPLDRGKRTMRVDLKSEDGVAILKKMIQDADVLVEPFRPGVMEKLGLGPEEALALNPRLIFARLTGWGQKGSYAAMAGHDINYIALSGALSLFRQKGEKPLPPCNLLGDFAGGGMLCAMGILLALIERSRSGNGQVIDAAMLDGAANLAVLFYGLHAHQVLSPDIGTNMLDTGAPFYQTYETADRKFMSVGAIETKFYRELLEGLGVDPSTLPSQHDAGKWPEMKETFAGIFKTKTRDEWSAVFDGTDACVAPVLDLGEVEQHPHNNHRDLLFEIDNILQPAPAPRLSRTPGRAEYHAKPRGAETSEVLKGLGYTAEEIGRFFETDAVE